MERWAGCPGGSTHEGDRESHCILESRGEGSVHNGQMGDGSKYRDPAWSTVSTVTVIVTFLFHHSARAVWRTKPGISAGGVHNGPTNGRTEWFNAELAAVQMCPSQSWVAEGHANGTIAMQHCTTLQRSCNGHAMLFKNPLVCYSGVMQWPCNAVQRQCNGHATLRNGHATLRNGHAALRNVPTTLITAMQHLTTATHSPTGARNMDMGGGIICWCMKRQNSLRFLRLCNTNT